LMTDEQIGGLVGVASFVSCFLLASPFFAVVTRLRKRGQIRAIPTALLMALLFSLASSCALVIAGFLLRRLSLEIVLWAVMLGTVLFPVLALGFYLGPFGIGIGGKPPDWATAAEPPKQETQKTVPMWLRWRILVIAPPIFASAVLAFSVWQVRAVWYAISVAGVVVALWLGWVSYSTRFWKRNQDNLRARGWRW